MNNNFVEFDPETTRRAFESTLYMKVRAILRLIDILVSLNIKDNLDDEFQFSAVNFALKVHRRNEE